MIIITEHSEEMYAPSVGVKRQVHEAALKLDIQTYSIPFNWVRETDATAALSHIPHQKLPTPGFINGFGHVPEEYEELYLACKDKNIILPNTPDEYTRIMTFDKAYPCLQGITPETYFVESVEDIRKVLNHLTFPIFAKGNISSRKERGWSACVANNPSELTELVSELLDIYYVSMGKVALRQLIPLRTSGNTRSGFPKGREYRIVLYQDQPMGWGYYWSSSDALTPLNPTEETAVLSLAIEASKRLHVPLVSVDIAQDVEGKWWVLEPGDPQCAGFGHIDVPKMLRSLQKALHRKET